MRLGIKKRIASEDELGGCDGHGSDAGLFERRGEEPGAEALAKGGEAIEEIRAGMNAGVNRDFVKQIASQELQFAAHAKVILIAEPQIVKHIEVKIQNELCLATGVRKLASGESVRDREKMVGDAFHGGDDDDDAGGPRGSANEACGMEHAVGAKKRTAAELECDDIAGLPGYAAGALHAMV